MILVVGSTGYVGSMITNQLAAKGTPVTALVRNATSDKAKGLKGAKLAVGDLKDPASLAKALAGVDTVVLTASSCPMPGPGDSIAAVDSKGALDLVDAAEKAGVKRFVFL